MALHKISSWKNQARMKSNNFMKQSLSWAANSRSATKFLASYTTRKLHNRFHKNPLLIPILNEKIQSTASYPISFKNHFNISLALCLGLPNSFEFSD
jgi:hypothetical protein